MKFWPLKKTASQGQTMGALDALVWEATILARVSLVPFIERFSLYRSIVESELEEEWDILVAIAMVGVAAQARGLLSNPSDIDELKKVLGGKWYRGADRFDDYYGYTILRTKKTGAPWSGVSAMWVADNLRLHSKANAALKKNASELDFVNSLSIFMNMSLVELPHTLGIMLLDAENSMGIDLGFGTKGAKKDPVKKALIFAEIIELFARKTVEMIAEDMKLK